MKTQKETLLIALDTLYAVREYVVFTSSQENERYANEMVDRIDRTIFTIDQRLALEKKIERVEQEHTAELLAHAFKGLLQEKL